MWTVYWLEQQCFAVHSVLALFYSCGSFLLSACSVAGTDTESVVLNDGDAGTMSTNAFLDDDTYLFLLNVVFQA